MTNDLATIVNAAEQLGLRVFVSSAQAAPTFAFFTNGVQVGYVQWSGGLEFSSVHKANRISGTSFAVDYRGSVAATMIAALEQHVPDWAQRDRNCTVKFRDLAEFLESRHCPLVEIGA